MLNTFVETLSLANEWGMEEMVLNTIKQSRENFEDPIDRLVLGHRLHIIPWFRAGLEELVRSDRDISIEEATLIGMTLTLRIYHARARCSREFWNSGVSESSMSLVSNVVEDMFAETWSCWKSSIDSESYLEGAHTGLSVNGWHHGSLGVLSQPSGDRTPATENNTENNDEGGPVPNAHRDITLIPDLFRAVLAGDARSKKFILEAVPKLCLKKETSCGTRKRCRMCCNKELRLYQPFPADLAAKTALGQVFVDHICEINAGRLGTMEIILENVQAYKKTSCGPAKRCGKCRRKAAKKLLDEGGIF